MKNSPEGCRLASSGIPEDNLSKSPRLRSIPILPAMASRWITKLVEPPMAAFTMMAFSKASFVSILDMRRSSLTISTMRCPEYCARTFRRLSAAGMAAFSGRVSPRLSTMQAMVDAVPITAQ